MSLMRRRTLLEENEIVEKELINIEELIYDTYINSTGNEAEYKGWSCTPYIPIKAGKRYLVANIRDNYNCMYDENKNKIVNLILTANSPRKTYEVIFEPKTSGYIRFSGSAANMQKASFIELGD